ncbi:MAG: bifunctional methylenetetrahydrofolate dehydrogenase/methenyltetrahydrofolate cyclohydrolase [Alphaproteobacteria bacterium]|jgi:methylenetetrahydrofolate dehydrogenase (NADP+) / methenyltetrahydrofolate cyclohydrolase|uniref:Bifunctional protein FolD n=1 Tax=Brevundimonas mediterranea TaxID=74329 RepID=A0A6G7ELQ0_9CAUL|nr:MULTISPECIES: bifunctional methylenetetrahydrofolate dehydrogenase/methenyltetrahydrofolate cyclohydrolase [Brevundimonas]MBU1271002.1 bifunctional methylenetetrahydrofolate dehydrogenase/methenyltetrahydrofolate cyclohydrolase [Alphaproteobacteria bacterium]OGN46599.1 MAG: bifunctional methylenetetrahydrofolate dehydrogenase/methenyltetrahydrofolate cyclohydrolase [Caulobacterales bacterium GWE1_67_11]OGN47012.1 MAG: bifunctional methylenetetrahydrofolate dehydrogenase/methenyltetrahydrofola
MSAEPARATLIDGKAFSVDLVDRVAAAAARLEASQGVKPGLAVVIVGEDPASQIYVRNKGETTLRAGMRSDTHRLDETTTQDELLALIARLNADAGIHGVLVQLPLPKHIDSSVVLDAIDPDKDVDGFHVVNAGRLAVGLPGLVPCTPLGSLMLLKDQLGDLTGLNAVIVGRSNIVGKPMAQLLLGESCTVTIAHSRTRDLPALCRTADILVAAVGRPEMIKGDWIKPGATVIDVGINRVPSADPVKAAEGKTRVVGDVAFKEAVEIAGRITPVPGGVGPMTIACLLANTYSAACRSIGVEPEPLDA